MITEMKNCVYAEDKDKPVEGNDHGIDALRYWFLWKGTRPELPDITMMTTIPRKNRPTTYI